MTPLEEIDRALSELGKTVREIVVRTDAYGDHFLEIRDAHRPLHAPRPVEHGELVDVLYALDLPLSDGSKGIRSGSGEYAGRSFTFKVEYGAARSTDVRMQISFLSS